MLNNTELLKYIGSHNQIYGTKMYTLCEGRQNGVRAVDVRNGSGLNFTVLFDRAMDISELSFQGINLSYLSSVGVASPQYYEKDGLEFLRTYTAGFLTTCGLTQVGVPNNDGKEQLGLHGRISHIPAEEIYAGTDWTEDGPIITVKGKIKQTRFFGENLTLCREIICRPGINKIIINDSVVNQGFRTEPLMLLYHINLGYPLLDENSYILASSRDIEPQNKVSKDDMDWETCHSPQKNYSERVYLHKNLWKDSEGFSFIALINEKIEKGVLVRFDGTQLDHLIQWKQLGEGEYVVGLEPSNCGIYGRSEARNRGVLKTIQPGHSETFCIEVSILNGAHEIDSFKE